MSELPKGWERVSLDQVVSDFVGGGTPPKAKAGYFSGKIPFMTIKDMTVRRPIDTIDHISSAALANSSSKVIPKDTIIIASRVGLGKVVRPQIAVAINQDLKALFTTPSINDDLLEYWFRYNASYLESEGRGTTVKGLRLEFLRALSLDLPPLNEQKRIVEKIEELFSQIDAGEAALKKAQALIKQYRQSLLKAAVTGELTKEWREKNKDKLEPADKLLARILTERRKAFNGRGKFKEATIPDAENLPEIPNGWTWATPEQLASGNRYDLCIGPFGSNLKVSDYKTSGVPLIFVRNIRSKKFSGSNDKFVSADKAVELSAHKVMGGDLLRV